MFTFLKRKNDLYKNMGNFLFRFGRWSWRHFMSPATSRRQDIIGLDIGWNKITFVRLKKIKRRLELVGTASTPTPQGAINERGIIVKPKEVANAVRKLFQENRVRMKRVATAVWGGDVITKIIDLPQMPEKEMTKVIREQVTRYAMFATEEAVVDFQIVEEIREEKRVRVLLIAVPNTISHSHIRAIGLARLNPQIIGIGSLAILHSIAAAHPAKFKKKFMASLVVDKKTANLNLLKEGRFYFSRSIDLGVDHLEDSSLWTQFKSEVQRTIDFYQRELPEEEKIRKIVLSIDQNKISGLDAYLKKELGIIVEMVDPLRNVKVDAQRFSREYIKSIDRDSLATATGLALWRRKSIPYGHQFNLLTLERQRKTLLSRGIATLIILLFLIWIFLVPPISPIQFKANKDKKKLAAIQEEILVQDKLLLEAKEEIERKDALLREIKGFSSSKILEEIKKIIPRTVWLEKISLSEKGVVFIEGNSLSQKAMDDFIKALNDSNLVSVTTDTVQQISMANRSVIKFKIKGEIK